MPGSDHRVIDVQNHICNVTDVFQSNELQQLIFDLRKPYEVTKSHYTDREYSKKELLSNCS